MSTCSGSGKAGGGECAFCGRVCANGGSLARHQKACESNPANDDEDDEDDDDNDDDDENEVEEVEQEANAISPRELQLGDRVILREALTKEQNLDIIQLVDEYDRMFTHLTVYKKHKVPMKHWPVHILVDIHFDANRSAVNGSKVEIVDTELKTRAVMSHPSSDDLALRLEYFLFKHNDWAPDADALKVVRVDSDGDGFVKEHPDLCLNKTERGITWCFVEDNYDADEGERKGDDSDESDDDSDDDDDDSNDDDDDGEEQEAEKVRAAVPVQSSDSKSGPKRGDVVYVALKVTKSERKSFCAVTSSNTTVRIQLSDDWTSAAPTAAPAAAESAKPVPDASDLIRQAESALQSLEGEDKKKRAAYFQKRRKELEADFDFDDEDAHSKAAAAWDTARNDAIKTFPPSRSAAELREKINFFKSCQSEADEQLKELREMIVNLSNMSTTPDSSARTSCAGQKRTRTQVGAE